MKIYIITMDDPIQTYHFIKDIIDAKRDQIVGLSVPNGDRLTLAKGKSKYVYIFSLLLIMGPFHFIKNSLITIFHKIKLILSRYGIVDDPSILSYAKKQGISVKRIKTPNNKEFREYLKSLDLDVIINQSQSFIRKELLEIPKIGVLNRHNALLPKNRGRLAPFWVLYNGERETGVSIHFVQESLDSGDILVQKRFDVTDKDTFNSLVKNNYSLASKAMIEALEKLENGASNFIKNDDSIASYNSTPLFSEAFTFRFARKKIK